MEAKEIKHYDVLLENWRQETVADILKIHLSPIDDSILPNLMV